VALSLFRHEPVVLRDQDDPVTHRDPEKGNEPDEGGDAEHSVKCFWRIETDEGWSCVRFRSGQAVFQQAGM